MKTMTSPRPTLRQATRAAARPQAAADSAAPAARRSPAPPVNPAAALAARRAGMILFAGEMDAGSHWVRFVLAEKDVDGAAVEWIRDGQHHEDLTILNPARTIPTYADREVVLHPARLIIEYLDERYPHPPLLPVEPAARARLRLALHPLEHTLYPLADAARSGPAAAVQKARKQLHEQLLAVHHMFPVRGWFLNPEFNIVDCAWAPLLWRLPSLGLPLPREGDPMRRYAERLFARPAFAQSLSPAERSLGIR